MGLYYLLGLIVADPSILEGSERIDFSAILEGFLLTTVAICFIQYIRYISTEYGFTNRRLILKGGFYCTSHRRNEAPGDRDC